MFIESAAGLKGDELERELFIVRKLMEKEKAAALGEDHWDFYACTLSNRTIVYKGMLNSAAGAQRRLVGWHSVDGIVLPIWIDISQLRCGYMVPWWLSPGD